MVKILKGPLPPPRERSITMTSRRAFRPSRSGRPMGGKAPPQSQTSRKKLRKARRLRAAPMSGEGRGRAKATPPAAAGPPGPTPTGPPSSAQPPRPSGRAPSRPRWTASGSCSGSGAEARRPSGSSCWPPSPTTSASERGSSPSKTSARPWSSTGASPRRGPPGQPQGLP